MLRRIAFTLILVTAIVSPIIVTAATNLVQNGDLESVNATTGLPTGWSSDYWGTMSNTFTYPVTGVNSSKAVRTVISSYSSGDAKWFPALVPVSAGTVYTLSDNFNSTVASEVDAEYLLSNGTYSYAWLADVPSSNSLWATYSGTVTPPAGVVSMSIFHLIQSIGSLTIDNLSIANGTTTPVPPPAPVVPVISSFAATPNPVVIGQSTRLAWTVSSADSYYVSGPGVSLTTTGTSTLVTPTATSTYTLQASNNGYATSTATVTVSVSPLPPPPAPVAPSITFTANPTIIIVGQSSRLSWTLTNATAFSVSSGGTSITTTGTSTVVTPTATTTYTLQATNNGYATSTATVTVSVSPLPPPPPPVAPTITFSANPTVITVGQSALLSWTLSNATAFSVSNGTSGIAASGTSTMVSPTATTTYTLQATNNGYATSTASVTVAVKPVPVPPVSNPNLIPNGNFEAGSTNAPTSWTGDYWGSLTAKFVYPVTGNGGGKAAQIQISRFTSGAANWISASIPASSHTMYQYSEDYTSNAATELDLEFLMQNGTYTYQWLQTVPASASWKTITSQVTVPAGVVSFRVLHILAKAGTLTIDNASLTSLTNPLAQGMVTFAFDDGLLSQYQNALPVLTSAGLKGSFYIITNEPASGDTGYMNWTQIKNLNTQGFEVGAHTRTHPYLTTLTATQLTSEVSGSYTDLVAQGITPKTFVYPFGDVNAAVETATKNAGFIGARGSYYGLNGAVTDHYDLYDIRVDASANLATLEAYVDQAKADKRWLVLELHDVVASGGDTYATTPTVFKALVSYIKASGIQVVTTQQGIAALNP